MSSCAAPSRAKRQDGGQGEAVSEHSAQPVHLELVSLLQARNLSLREAARRADVDVAHLSRITAGEKVASPELAARLAEALELPRDYFPEYRQGWLEQTLRRDPELRDRLYRDLS
jgi:transcriptional regulator with XRE-family HTH domain